MDGYRKGGKKGRKIGRQKRKASHLRYVASKRSEFNKLLRQEKIKKILEAKKRRKAYKNALQIAKAT